jgi:amino acid transporter
MGYGPVVFVAVAAVVIFLAAAGQVLAYRRGQTLLTRPQLLLRLGTALALLAVLGLIVWGTTTQIRLPLPEATRPERLTLLRQAAGFWTAVMLLLVAAIVMALLDLRYVRAAQHRIRAAMYQNMARLQSEVRAEAERRKSKEKGEDQN